jgi:hypothetical protein
MSFLGVFIRLCSPLKWLVDVLFIRLFKIAHPPLLLVDVQSKPLLDQ